MGDIDAAAGETAGGSRRLLFLAPSGPTALRVRVGRPGFATAHPALVQTRVHPCTRPLRGLIVRPPPLRRRR
ncbi:MAG TPA: hypothetical protein VFG21_12555, partial [Xanthomonadaceae bacterium]|nr:hypothetical protein [Xanthomonadaceae bacterium]